MVKVTLRQYLNNHFLHSSQGYKVADSSFNNNDKIDLHSSDFRHEHLVSFGFRRILWSF